MNETGCLYEEVAACVVDLDCAGEVDVCLGGRCLPLCIDDEDCEAGRACDERVCLPG